MKYIRTKNGVYEYLGEDNIGWRRLRLEGKFIVKQDPNVEIIREAKTIEELCDCFVLSMSPRAWRIFNKPLVERENLSEIRDLISWYGQHSETMYGAIETDKGLIYVAKANEKGELELL